MTEDSEEKILSDWNNGEQSNSFDDFDSLYRYIKQHAQTQGIQGNKVANPNYPNTKVEREAMSLFKDTVNEITSDVIEYRRRIKDLKKNRN